MAQERLAMRDIKELLRLRFRLKLSQRKTAKASGVKRTTVQNYEAKALAANLTDPDEIDRLSVEEVYIRLGFGPHGVIAAPSASTKPLPNWSQVHEDLLRHKHTTLMLLWTEYKETHPGGYQYSQFCDLYGGWKRRISLVMRQEHKAGEKTFIDYAGSTIDVIDQETGEVRAAQIFVSALGASSYVFAEATWTQTLPDWLMSHRRMVEYYKGVSEILVPDNLKSGVTKADRYEAKINRAYQEFAEHYGTCVIPARARKPKDKAKAEVNVQVVSRWIIAALRNRTFYSLEELNEAIVILLARVNGRKMRHIGKSRLDLYEQIEKPLLKPLPPRPYEFGEWKEATVNIDYHIQYDDAFYSTPHQLVQTKIWVRATNSVVEIYQNFQRIFAHRRTFIKGKYVTEPSHRPVAHQEHAKWTPERVASWAGSKGTIIGEFVKLLIARKVHYEQNFRSALGVIRLTDEYGAERMQLACQKAIRIESISYQTISNMLKNGMEKIQPTDEELQMNLFSDHENVRGANYYP
jgi:transposase